MLPHPTDRLRFREMAEADVDDISSLDRGGSRGPAAWIEWTLDSYAEHGFGLWVVETHDGEFVGDCGLTMQEVEGEWFVETGWHVRSDLRRRGYATEAARAVCEAARAGGVAHLVAIIRPENHASQGVARAIGMSLERETVKRDRPALVFATSLDR